MFQVPNKMTTVHGWEYVLASVRLAQKMFKNLNSL